MEEAPDDAFALLGLPRRPFLDGEDIRARFREIAVRHHPDAPGGDTSEFRRADAARRLLLDPAARLRLLVELVCPGVPAPVAQPPSALFAQVGEATHRARAVLASMRAATSPLGRAVLFREVLDAEVRVDAAIGDLVAWREGSLARLISLDARWPEVGADELSALATDLVFVGRWLAGLEALRLEFACLEGRPKGEAA